MKDHIIKVLNTLPISLDPRAYSRIADDIIAAVHEAQNDRATHVERQFLLLGLFAYNTLVTKERTCSEMVADTLRQRGVVEVGGVKYCPHFQFLAADSYAVTYRRV